MEHNDQTTTRYHMNAEGYQGYRLFDLEESDEGMT